MTYRFLVRARIDLDHAYDWYESRRPGLGDEFAREVSATVGRVVSQPAAFARYPGTPARFDVRFLRVRRFRYLVVYEPGPYEVLIVSVAHDKASSSPWRRLRRRS